MYGWTFEKKKFEIPLCKGEQCLPLRGKHENLWKQASVEEYVEIQKQTTENCNFGDQTLKNRCWGEEAGQEYVRLDFISD